MTESLFSQVPAPTYPKPGTQPDKVLKVLMDAKGEWVNGQYFCRTLWLTQFHAVIFNLENRYGWVIEHSDFKDAFGFKSYRITARHDYDSRERELS